MPNLSSSLKAFAFIVCTLSLLTAVTLIGGLFVGFVLNYFVPSIDLGIATICGLAAIAIPFYAIVQAIVAIKVKEDLAEVVGNGEMNDDYDDDADVLTDEQAETLAEQLMEAMMLRMSTIDARPKRHSGRSH